jgi:predicted O-methyltransferase YrrM
VIRSQLLHFLLHRLGLAAAGTQVGTAEREALLRRAAGRRHLVEIGVWHGATTRRLREVMAEDATITGVDPFPRGRLGVSFPLRIALREVARCERGRFALVRRSGANAAVGWSGPVDFLFIDGDHSWDGIRADWEGWAALVEPGGVVCLHDSRATPERPIADAGSVRYTEDVIARDPRFEVVEQVATLTVLVRRERPAESGPEPRGSGGRNPA